MNALDFSAAKSIPKETVKRNQPSRQAKRMSIPAENIKTKAPGNCKSYKKQLEEKILYKAPANEFLEGEIVLATIPGYAPWPARILQNLNETIFVQFFWNWSNVNID